MQEFLGSVRRSMVFRPLLEDNQETFNNSPLTGTIMEKINSCVRKSRIFSKPTSPSLPAAPPIRYRKGELIGFGAFGHVYMGMNLDSGELLAIKQVLIAANGASREKAQAHIKELEDEVKLLKNLSHPNIVRYLGTVREEETLNILLEFVPGGSISSLLGKFGPFPEAVIRAYTKQLLLGLEYLHNNGIMHRDIKGANILVDNKGCIKLADFGASKQVVELATVSGAKSMKGTPYWMAPEVILQTGHSFSADIWSVGCTVIEMATGKPPWSQQYQEVAALFYVGSTKSHPEIPEHLSAEAKDFLLKCLQKEPNMRPDASKLLQHQFVTGNHLVADPVICTPVAEISEVPSKLQTTNNKIEASSIFDTEEICNLGSLSCSMDLKKPSQVIDMWRTNNSDDDMCQIGKDDFTLKDVRLSPVLTANDNDKSSEPKDIVLGDWRCKFGDSLEPEVVGLRPDTDQLAQDNSNGSFPRGASVSEDDDELTESKIRAFLDEKALELKKLQTPLYEEFYNSLNAACSPSLVEKSRHETSPNYLKLPPKSRSPSRVPVGTPSTATDAVSTGTPGSNSRHVSNVDNASGQISEDTSSPQHNDHRVFVAEVQPESSSLSPSLSFSEIQRRWKEELDQELEKNREMRRQAGVVGKTSSPKDRSSTRQRERTRFASPGK